MKEIEVLAGEHLEQACKKLAKEAPAFMIFNDVRVEAHGGETPADLVSRWSKEFERRVAAYRTTDEYKKQQAESEARRARDTVIRDEALAAVDRSGIRAKYPWEAGMGEISGFGGAYEEACRNMVYAGLAWLESKPGADLKASTYKGVYGILNAESEDAKALEKAALAACPDCSGAMHQATMSACMYIAEHGWPAYVAAMTKTP